MGAIDYGAMAPEVLALVGGRANITSLSHCATRLRLRLADPSKADTDRITALPGVVTVVTSGGQYQIVIGNDVPRLYAAVQDLIGDTGGAETDAPEESRSLFDRFIALISALLHPILWTLAGAGLIKAFLSLAVTLGWIGTDGTTYIILNAAGDSIIYFLPVALAVTSGKYFHTNTMTSLAIAGALVYPSIVALNAPGTEVTFFGIPVVMTSYASSLIPIIFAVWAQSHVERWFTRILPGAIRNFTVPLLSLVLIVPLTLLVIGPITTWASMMLSTGILWLFAHVPWLAGAVLGATWQLMVMFGVHWGLIPVMINNLTTQGFEPLNGPILAAVLAQGAAAVAVMIRTRNLRIKRLAGPAAVSGLLAGITEPAIYGVNLPLKKPFIFGCVGGAIGGVFAAMGGIGANSFVFPSFVGLPAFLSQGSMLMLWLSIASSMLVGFLLTFFFGVNPHDTGEAETPAAAPAPAAAATGPIDRVQAPLAGTLVPLDQIADPAFASGALGAGVGILPSGDGELTLTAPVGGTVVTAVPTGHAFGIRTPRGAEVLLHIGIDTVTLHGEGFQSLVTQKQTIAAGDPLVRVDLPTLQRAGLDLTTIMVVTNTAALADISPVASGTVAAGETLLELHHHAQASASTR